MRAASARFQLWRERVDRQRDGRGVVLRIAGASSVERDVETIVDDRVLERIDAVEILIRSVAK